MFWKSPSWEEKGRKWLTSQISNDLVPSLIKYIGHEIYHRRFFRNNKNLPGRAGTPPPPLTDETRYWGFAMFLFAQLTAGPDGYPRVLDYSIFKSLPVPYPKNFTTRSSSRVVTICSFLANTLKNSTITNENDQKTCIYSFVWVRGGSEVVSEAVRGADEGQLVSVNNKEM